MIPQLKTLWKVGGGAVAAPVEENDVMEIPTNMTDDSVSSFRALGFSVDDDNDPAPKNVPSPSETTDDGIYKDWNSVPWDERKLIGANDFLPTLTRADVTLHTVRGYFNHFLPVAYLKDTVLPATNACLTHPMTWEEFLRFIGLILLMATAQGNARQDFWSSDNPEMFSDAPFRPNAFMSGRRFENILYSQTLEVYC